jgi:hypothetical protein
VLQQTLAGFKVRCSASRRLHHALCRRLHSRVQAAAAARVAGGPDILKSVKCRDGASVLCHVIADADGVNKRDPEYYVYLPPTPLCPSFVFIIFMQQDDSFAFLQSTHSTALLCYGQRP